MLAELHRCPSLFATTNDQSSIMAKMSKSADTFIIYVATANGISYQEEFNEETLSNVKSTLGEFVSWPHFFDVLRNTFYSGSVSIQYINNSNTIKVICHDAGSKEGKSGIYFSVNKTNEDVLPLIVKDMVELHHMFVNPKEKERALDKLEAEVAQAKTQVEQLEKEISVMNINNERRRRMNEQNTQRIKELQISIAEEDKYDDDDDEKEENQKINNGISSRETSNGNTTNNSSEETTIAKGRIRQPLGDDECKDFDIDLLRLIKSRWITSEDSDLNAPYNNVIIPYTKSEMSSQIQNFMNKQHELIWKALDKIDEWDYNVFEVQTAMSGDDYESLQNQPNGGSLFITMYALLMRYGFLEKFNIDEKIALNWISNVEAGYNGNPYHNSMHAADVLHITHFILSQGGLAKRCELSDKQVFAALFAAAIHDYNHPGVNNNFHVKTQSYSATLYNDRSVLENVHVSSVFELMKNPKFNILSAFSEEHRREIRETIIEMVLATDMGLHGKYVAQFKRRLSEHVSFTTREDQHLALAIALKMADISNCGRPLEIYLKWSSKVSDEFYMQGDRERVLGMPCSPFMDRMEPTLAKGQIAFMNYIIIPFFEMIAELLPDMRFAVDCAEKCKAYWMQPGHD